MANAIDHEWEDITPQDDSDWETISEISASPVQTSDPSFLRKTAMSVIDSPILPIAGGIAGAISGAGVASIPLSGLGAAGGESFRQLGARFLDMPSPQSPGLAAKEIAKQGAIGSLSELGGQVLFRGVPRALPFLGKGANATGRALAGGVEKITGIPTESTIQTFKKPLALFKAPTQKDVSKAYGNSEFPDMAKNFDEIIEAGVSSVTAPVRRGARALKEYVDGIYENAGAILEGRKGLDKQIASLQVQIDAAKGSSKSALEQAKKAKINLRNTFNRALDKLAPKVRKADKLAAERFEVAPFRSLTLPGKVNLFSPEGILRAVPGVPSAMGATVSGLGAAKKAITSEPAKKLISQGVGQIVNKKPKKVIQNGHVYVLNEQTGEYE